MIEIIREASNEWDKAEQCRLSLYDYNSSTTTTSPFFNRLAYYAYLTCGSYNITVSIIEILKIQQIFYLIRKNKVGLVCTRLLMCLFEATDNEVGCLVWMIESLTSTMDLWFRNKHYSI